MEYHSRAGKYVVVVIVGPEIKAGPFRQEVAHLEAKAEISDRRLEIEAGAELLGEGGVADIPIVDGRGSAVRMEHEARRMTPKAGNSRADAGKRRDDRIRQEFCPE